MFLAVVTNTQNFWAETKGSLFLLAYKGHVKAEMNVICLYDSDHFSLLLQYKALKKKTATNFQPSAGKYTSEQVKRERERERESANSQNFRYILMIRVVLVQLQSSKSYYLSASI